MMRELALIGLLLAAPAAATVTIQTKSISLDSLGLGPINDRVRFADFTSFGLTDEHLTSVSIVLDARINGTVDAVNSATGGNARSRRRDISASYTLYTGVAGHGLAAGGGATDGQTRSGVPGQGTLVTLNSINPEVIGADTVTARFAPFLNGPVRFDYSAEAVFASVPAADVVFGTPTITGGRAFFALIYESAIPEPATWSLLIAGFGLTGAMLRRRRIA